MIAIVATWLATSANIAILMTEKSARLLIRWGWSDKSTANIYTCTPIVYNTVYINLIRHRKHLLVVVYKYVSRILLLIIIIIIIIILIIMKLLIMMTMIIDIMIIAIILI